LGKFDVADVPEEVPEIFIEKTECQYCFREFSNINSHLKTCKENPANKPKDNIDISQFQIQINTLTEAFSQMKQSQLKNEMSKNLLKEIILQQFNQLKTYFRKGKRPSQIEGIKNFEINLNKL